MSILTENQNQVRKPMKVFCGISGRQNIANGLFSASGSIKLSDSDIKQAMTNETWDMVRLADFQGEGFPLDGSCELYEPFTASEDNGKVGLRTDVGGSMNVTVSSSATINALTIAVTSGTGTITAGGRTYEARRIVVIPVNATSITLTIASNNPAERLEIASITGGISLSFSNEDLISCSLDLRSDLKMIGSSWEISSIEIHAYYPDDISEAVSNIGDDVPIWYYAGYDDDFSFVREFYLSEPASQTNNELIIIGEDASHKLEDADNVVIQRLDTIQNSGFKSLYNWFIKCIKETGIKPVSVEGSPSTIGQNHASHSLVMQSASPREYVQDIMNLSHQGHRYIRFVDAGRPVIKWSKPSSIWDIYEEDCGEVSRIIDRNIAKIVSDDEDYGVINTATRSTKWTVIQADMKIQNNKKIIKNLSEWFWAYKVSYKKNKKFTFSLINRVAWTASKTSKKVKKKKNGKTVTEWLYRPTLYGKRLNVSVNKRSVTPTVKRSGYTASITPLAVGKIYNDSEFTYPNYSLLFDRSNICGTFVWKGNPNMQPRDVFTFHRLDGSEEICTIESIQLEHAGGGTMATISYRLGVV